MTSIFIRLTIGFGDFWIVNVTPTLNSWKLPEFDHGDLERKVGRRRDLVVARGAARRRASSRRAVP